MKPRGKPFQKGNKLGTGRPKLPDDLRALMRATSEEIKRDLCEVWLMNKVDLQHAETLTNLTAGRAACISALNNVIQSNDLRGIYIFLDRILGKIPEMPIGDGEDKSPDSSKDETIARLVKIMNDGIKNETQG